MNLVASGELYRKFDETPQNGRRLGRNLWLDGRSLAFMVENEWATMAAPMQQNVYWARRIPILNQGAVGSCTGNAGTGALGTEPYYSTLGDAAALDEDYALRLYSAATRIDGYPGLYPPDDTGSSGLAVCKVLKKWSVIRKYRWARTPYGFARLLQAGPVLFGMPWYNAFWEPKLGFIDTNSSWPASGLAGGHEVEVLGIEIDPHDFFSSILTIANSWGTTWGDQGYFYMRMRTYEQMEWTDLKQFILG